YLCLVRQIVWVNANAMTSDKSRAERQEVPFSSSCSENSLCVDTHLVEDDGKFIDERDIQIALRILDDLRSLSNTDAFSLVRSCCDDAGVNFVNSVGHFGSRTRGNLANVWQPVIFVPGINPLR